MTPLQQAAQAVIGRWETTFAPSLQRSLTELRKALDAELQQPVEPVAFMTGDGRVSMAETVNTAMPKAAKDSFCIPLYLHPPQPQATTPVPELLEELENCRDLLKIAFPDAPVDSCIGVGIIKASAAIAAAQGEKL